MSKYRKVYDGWKADPEGFWAKAAAEIDWIKPWDKVFDRVDGLDRWFVGAECNTCWNAVDRHVKAGRGDQPAIIHDSAITGTKQTFTYAQLQDEVATLGAVLAKLGVGKGDRVILYMPMIPEAVIGMLACARIGAIHSVVFGGFAPHELATRIDDAKPKLILTASCGLEPGRVIAYKPLLDKAIELATPQARCLPDQAAAAGQGRTGPRDHDWDALVAAARKAGRARRLRAGQGHRPALHSLYFGHDRPAQGRGARQWRPHGRAQMVDGEHLRREARRGLLGGVRCRLGRRPFLHRLRAACCMAARRSCSKAKPVGTPDAGTFWRVVQDHKVAALFTAPTAFRAIKKEDPDGAFIAKYDISSLRTLFLAGERADPDTVKWAEDKAQGSGRRSLVADRDRLVDRRQSGRPRHAAGQVWFADRADAGL